MISQSQNLKANAKASTLKAKASTLKANAKASTLKAKASTLKANAKASTLKAKASTLKAHAKASTLKAHAKASSLKAKAFKHTATGEMIIFDKIDNELNSDCFCLDIHLLLIIHKLVVIYYWNYY